MKELGITPDEIHNLPLSAVGVTTIPAFVITDGAGSVIEIWNGKLPPRVQSLIFERLNLTDTRPTSEWLVQEDELPELLKRNGGAVVLDVRDRESFSKRHIPKAINIPLDELQVRASNELSTENLFVITARDDFQSDLAYKLLDTQGFSRLLILLPSASNQ